MHKMCTDGENLTIKNVVRVTRKNAKDFNKK